ncbi:MULTISPECIES: hypothetical protein [unclassified Herbaspirillum]|nr:MULTISPECIES: hypothetical protein [unclassified Herbaspirillum]MBB5391734.1 hypothetical protein [Herbaspirillum sp. SJZ102]
MKINDLAARRTHQAENFMKTLKAEEVYLAWPVDENGQHCG